MKKTLRVFTFLAVILPFTAFAQYPTPLTEANYPKAGDSIRVLAYTIQPTQAYTDSTSANDSLSIDRTLQKAIQVNNSTDPMSDIAIGGNRNDTIAIFYYQAFAQPPFTRKFDAYNNFFPGASNFPTATLHTIIPTSEGNASTYYKKDATGFYELGFYVVTTSGAMTSINNPAKPVALFPIDYASPNNITNFNLTSTTSVPGTTITTYSTLSVTIDAYGDVTIVDGNMGSPTYTTHSDYLRLCTYSEDNMDLGSGMNFYIKTKVYAYQTAASFEPVASYSVAQIRSNIDPMYWGMGLGQWEDEVEFAYSKAFTPSSIEENTESYYNIFPNPTEGPVQLNFNNMTEEQISADVYDINGKLIGSYTRDNGSIEFDLSSMPSGTYIVHLRINDKVFPSKLIKK
jgi:hypothetical protein